MIYQKIPLIKFEINHCAQSLWYWWPKEHEKHYDLCHNEVIRKPIGN